MPFEFAPTPKDLRANSTARGIDVTDTVNQRQMSFEVRLQCARLGTEVTLKRLDVTKFVNNLQVSLQTGFQCKHSAANLALVSAAVSAMNCSQMSIQVAFPCKLPATNLCQRYEECPSASLGGFSEQTACRKHRTRVWRQDVLVAAAAVLWCCSEHAPCRSER